MPKRWTEDELATLARLYPRHGVRLTAARLKRSKKAVRVKAYKEGITFGLVPGRLSLKEIVSLANVREPTVRKAAMDAGVMQVHGTGRKIATTPEKWARAYIQAVKARKDADTLAGSWYSLTQAAHELGVHRKTITNALAGQGSLAHALEGAIVRDGTSGRRYVSPASIETAKSRIRDGTWLTYKQVANLWGCRPHRLKAAQQGRGALAPLFSRLRSKLVPARGKKGRVRVFHAKEVHALTGEAHERLDLGREVAA